MHAKDITPFKNGRRHGNWFKYWDDGRFNFMENYVDGEVFGHTLAYHYHGIVLTHIEKEYYAR